MTPQELQQDFDGFYEDFFCELAKYGNLQEMHVCDNVGDHLLGNVYARYEWEAEAQKAVDNLNDRWYSGKPLYAELSPVTDFREACCRQNEMGECTRGGFCNFMHLSHPTPTLVRDLQASQRLERRKLAAQPSAAGATNGDGHGDLGWTPAAAVGGGGGDDAGWVPPSQGGEDHGEQEGDSWRPSRYRR